MGQYTQFIRIALGIVGNRRASNRIWSDINKGLEDYTIKMDIIYDDAIGYHNSFTHHKPIFWNGTTIG
jgi:hypothetical protein